MSHRRPGNPRTLGCLTVVCLAVLACGRGATLPPPRVKTFETPPMRIDRIFTSMAGPFERVSMDFSDLDWVTAFKSEVVDASTDERLPDELFCHSQIQLPNSTRLMVTATGSSELRFPTGFAMPMARIVAGLPAEQRGLSLLGMVLNNHDAKMDRMVRVRGTIEYYRNQDLPNPPPFGKLFKEGLTLEMDDAAGGTAVPAVNAEGVSEHCATVNGIKSHWYVPPGPQLTRKRYSNIVPVEGMVHFASAHLHNYGRYVLLRDTGTGEVLWRTDAEYESDRVQLKRIPTYVSDKGFPLFPDHEYEVEAYYDNTSKETVDAMAQIDMYYWPKGNVNITYPSRPH